MSNGQDDAAPETTNLRSAAMKKCYSCGQIKPSETDFHRNRAQRDGRATACKKCRIRIEDARRRGNPERAARYDKARRARHREQRMAYQREWKKRFPEKYVAHYTYRNALSRGKIARPSKCSACGVACKPDGHHEDYSKPLEITWLCRKCHAIATADQKKIVLPEGKG